MQQAVEEALARLSGGARVAVLGAGRTDAGVHATGQVIAFDLDWTHGEAALLRAVNANLPPSIAAKALEVAPPDFHPRYWARSRRYRYTIYNSPVRSPLLARTAWHVWPRLDFEAMAAASRQIVGEHDFATFGADPDGANTVRTVVAAEWRREGETLIFEIEAQAFLYRMVRSLVGTLRLVGAGGMTAAEFAQALAAANRRRSGPSAPPHGLCLVAVNY